MLHTARLTLRRFEDHDLPRFASLNADPSVMKHFPRVRTASETGAFMQRANAEIDRWGYGLWAVEVSDTSTFAGFTGLHHHDGNEYPFPCVEVGWRLHRDSWGSGLATEAAQAAIGHGLDMGVDGIVSFTVPRNVQSVAVMERLGLTHDPNDDFDHPRFEPSSPFSRHVLYRVDSEAFRDLHRSERLYSLL